MKPHSRILVTVVLAMLAGVACSSQKSAEQQKVDELQAQLDEAKKQLEAKEQATPAEAPAPEPAPAEAAAPAAPAGASKGTAAKSAAARKGTATPAPAGATAPAYVTAEQGKKASDQYAQDKEKVKGAFEQQAQTNQQVQAQIEEMKPREYTIPAGTVVPVRTTTELSTKTLSNGSVFEAVLEKPIVVDGTTLAPEGAPVTGVVVSSDPGGRVKGVASLEVTIRSIVGVRNTAIRVRAGNYGVDAKSSKGKDAARTGILTGAGAVVGAIAGGGKGAAIGAGAGAAAGVGTNMATRGKPAVIPAESLMEFTLTAPSTVVVRP